MFELRGFQQRAHEECVRHFAEGKRRVMMVGPPRTGKNTMIAYQADAAASKGHRVLCWAHKRELVGEVQKRLSTQIRSRHRVGFIMSGMEPNPTARIQLMSTATGIRRAKNLKWLKDTAIIIGDEAHRIKSNGQFNVLLPMFPGARVIGYTATPFRNDGKGFEDLFDAIVQITTFQEQVDARVLVPSIVYHPDVSVSLDGVQVRYGTDGKDFDQSELSERYTEIKALEGLYGLWMRQTRGHMQTMCFNVDKKSNHAVCAYIRSKGVNAVSIDEGTPMDNPRIGPDGNPIGRKQLLEKYYKGPFCENPIMWLNNVGLFSEGIDAPMTKCVILNYATLSLSKLIQSAARGSGAMFDGDNWLIDPRTGRNYKEKVIILDMGNNFVRHMTTLETYDQFGFDLSGKPKKGNAPTRECPECHVLISINSSTCPHCGAELPKGPPSITGEVKKVGANEVDFKVLDHDQVTVRKMLDLMSNDEAVVKHCHVAWLRINALVNRKGDPNAYARSIILDKYKSDPEKCLSDINSGHSYKLDREKLMEIVSSPAKLEDFLTKREIKSSCHERYLRFKTSFIRL